jgi:histidinol-phosphate aminotransferase
MKNNSQTMFTLEKLIRKNILDLVPYSSARDEYSGEEAIFLDANENPYNTGANRYPDPLQLKLKVRIGQVKNIHYENIFLGNGSDEAIDLLIRIFCEPGTDNIVCIQPTYGMYKVAANINNVEFREVLLKKNYQIDKEAMLRVTDQHTKLIFLCSPNNPTSNSLYKEDIQFFLDSFEGIIVLDEAYIDFSEHSSFLSQLANYPNLVILQTLSKAWGMAGVRLGMALASRDIIRLLTKVKYPYNINKLSQQFAFERLSKGEVKDAAVKEILLQRERLLVELTELKLIREILPSDANFLMVRFDNPKPVFQFLLSKKIILRDRSKIPLCEGCLRITVGTKEENDLLLKALKKFEQQ